MQACFYTFLDATTHLYERLCPSDYSTVRRSIRRLVPCYFWTTKIADFEGGETSNDSQQQQQQKQQKQKQQQKY